MDEIILKNNNGQVITSSRDVAEKFGKKHAEVLYAIEGRVAFDSAKGKNVIKHNGLLMGGHDQLLKMFTKNNYIDSKGRTQYEYLMNRDGFSLLVMGFNGKEALEWKLKYIDAFNKMEETLRSQSTRTLPTTYKEALLQLVEQVEENEKLLADNNHKQEVINGLTDNVDIYKKKDVINRICRRRNGNYANRYKELYKCFRENFHIDLEARCEGYNLKQNKKKDQLSVIKYAEQFGYIDDLYSCCSKLFEAEIDEVLDQINSIHS